MAFPTQAQLDDLIVEAKQHSQRGQLPTYVPLLASAQPDWCAVTLHRVTGDVVGAGDHPQPFPLMSVVKPFVVLFCLQQWGRDWLLERVGVQPSDQPFAAIAQLEQDGQWPRNPMINSGALTLAGHLGDLWGATACAQFCDWLNHLSGSRCYLDQAMLQSVRSLTNQQNRQLLTRLTQAGRVANPDLALDTYNQICCLAGTVDDLAQLGLLLARSDSPIPAPHRRLVNAVMTTCGLYEYSSQFAAEVGIPSKSGIGGGILAVVPGWGAIATYSPPLDSMGTSVGGLFLIRHLADSLDLSVFN